MSALDWFNLGGMGVVLVLGAGCLTMLTRRAIRSYRVWKLTRPMP